MSQDIEEYQKNKPEVEREAEGEVEVEGLNMDGLVKKPADARRIGCLVFCAWDMYSISPYSDFGHFTL